MDISSQYFSDLFSFKSYSMPADTVEPSSSSTSSEAAGTGRRAVHSNEEVLLLATSRPKKRAGRRIFNETRHPVFRGVRRRNKDKWVCELREPNKKTRIWLGTYPTPEMAARAHDVAAIAFKGKAACVNFADSAWRLPVPASKDAVDIRRAAAEAAELFRPQKLKEQENSEVSRFGKKKIVEEKVEFVDEEAMLEMPKLLVSMAEGLLLSPPRNWEDDAIANSDIDVSLWSYSI